MEYAMNHIHSPCFFIGRETQIAIKMRKVASIICRTIKGWLKWLKGHCPAEIAKFRLAYFHVISPNTTKYTTKLDEKIL